MDRAVRGLLSPDAVRHLLAALLALLLLLSLEGVAPSVVTAEPSSASISTIRQRQVRAESAMRRADKQIKRLKRQHSANAKRYRAVRKRLGRLIRHRDNARRQAGNTQDSVSTVRVVRDYKLRVRPNPTGIQVADAPRLRRRVRKLKARVDHLERKDRKLTREIKQARKVKQSRARKARLSNLESRRESREHAESRLGDGIAQMLALSKERADARLSAGSSSGFRRPARGHISQPYGCQRVRRSKAGSRCTRYHDGIDIATSRGMRVRASASGFVAYVGWNPWDRGKRSYVVIVGHTRGYESVYAHLKPVRKVKSGQRVKRGDVIGVVGMTGRTSGPHVHWEVGRDFHMTNPLRAGRS